MKNHSTLPPHVYSHVMSVLTDNADNINAAKALRDWALSTTRSIFCSADDDIERITNEYDFESDDRVLIITSASYHNPTKQIRIAWNKYINLTKEFGEGVKVYTLKDYIREFCE